MGSLFFSILVPPILLSLIVWAYYFRHYHIGYGMVLIRRKSDGTVWVVSRLHNSPAEKAGIQNRIQVESVNGESMIFPIETSFRYWAHQSKPKIGQKEMWTFTNGLRVTLEPSIVRQKIPIYWNPNATQVGEKSFNQDVNSGLGWCPRTGQYITTASISPSALREVYF